MKLSGSEVRANNHSLPMRLQVFLSHNGVCSRRKAFGLIREGKVTVNGQVIAEPSTPVNFAKDKIFVDGKEIKRKIYEYVLFNKPRGCVTTKADRFAGKTVFDLIPSRYAHLVPVGRLDKDTEGLLLLTNDGDVTYKLTHPGFRVDKTYAVRINGRLNLRNKKRLEDGVVINPERFDDAHRKQFDIAHGRQGRRVEDKKTAPAGIRNVRILHNHTEFLITIHEGRKRQIRLMLAAVGHKVTDLKRMTQGPLRLGALKTGDFRKLTEREIAVLKNI